MADHDGESVPVAFGPGHPEWCNFSKDDDADRYGGSHCPHWWDHEPCCWCSDNTCTDAFCEFEGCPNCKEPLS